MTTNSGDSFTIIPELTKKIRESVKLILASESCAFSSQDEEMTDGEAQLILCKLIEDWVDLKYNGHDLDEFLSQVREEASLKLELTPKGRDLAEFLSQIKED
jgi:hypothetical protein